MAPRQPFIRLAYVALRPNPSRTQLPTLRPNPTVHALYHAPYLALKRKYSTKHTRVFFICDQRASFLPCQSFGTAGMYRIALGEDLILKFAHGQQPQSAERRRVSPCIHAEAETALIRATARNCHIPHAGGFSSVQVPLEAPCQIRRSRFSCGCRWAAAS